MDFDEDLKKLVALSSKYIARVRVEAEEVHAECEKSQRLIGESLQLMARVSKQLRTPICGVRSGSAFSR